MLVVRNIAGFLLQILPCAFLCLYPFSNRFKVPMRSACLIAGGILAAFCAVFAAVGSVPLDPVAHEYRIFAQNVVFLLAICALAVPYLTLIQAEAPKKLFVLLTVAVYGCLVTYAQDALRVPMGVSPDHDGYMYQPALLAALLVVNAVGIAPMTLVMSRVRRLVEGPVDTALWRQMCVLPAGFLIVAVFSNWMVLNLHLPVDTANRLLSLGIILLAVALAWWVVRLLERTDQMAIERTRVEAEAHAYRTLAENADELRRMRHDMNRHLQTVDAYLRTGDETRAQAYLGQAIESYARIPSAMICANPLVNAILTDYTDRARAAGVSLECQVALPACVNVADTDLCRLIANMLDNALDGCRAWMASEDANGIDRADAVIEFTMRQEGAFLFVSCENPCHERGLRRRGTTFASTKLEGGHGIGQSIMAKIAREYNGTFTCDVEDGRFCATAHLCPGDAEGRA